MIVLQSGNIGLGINNEYYITELNLCNELFIVAFTKTELRRAIKRGEKIKSYNPEQRQLTLKEEQKL